jgi:hypothetical protein
MVSMRVSRTTRALSRSLRFAIIGSFRVARACRPWVARAGHVWTEIVAREADGLSSSLTRHALLAGAAAGTVALAKAFAGPGVSELLDVAGAVAVGAIAVSAVICVARRSRRGGWVHVRALIVATARRVAPAHRQLLAVKTLEFVCAPRSFVLLLTPGPWLGQAAEWAVTKVILDPALERVPVFGLALQMVGVCKASVRHALFVREFETSAAQLCESLAA